MFNIICAILNKKFSERECLMKKIRIGVLGAARGTSMINYCKSADNAEVVAICDKAPQVLEKHRREAGDLPITFYDNFVGVGGCDIKEVIA